MAVSYDLGFLGFAELDEEDFPLFLQCRNASGVPTTPTGSPTFTVYAPGGTELSLASGSLGAADHDSKTGLRLGSVDLTEANGFESGQTYLVLFEYVVSAVTYSALGNIRVT